MSRVTFRTKPCKTCGTVKRLIGFYRHPSHADGRMNDCKECKKAYSREQHWLKRETILVRKRVYNATPARRAARAAYAKSARGKALMAESKRAYRFIRRAQVADTCAASR